MTGQMNLFYGKRQRGRQAPAPTEFEVHCAIADTLRRFCSWVWWHTPNGGEREHVTGADGKVRSPEGGRLQRMGTRAGVSDFVLVKPGKAQLHALELKRKGIKPTQHQLDFLADIRMSGGRVEWCDNFADAIRILKEWGALPSTINVT